MYSNYVLTCNKLYLSIMCMNSIDFQNFLLFDCKDYKYSLQQPMENKKSSKQILCILRTF